MLPKTQHRPLLVFAIFVENSASQYVAEYRVAPFASGYFSLTSLAHSCSSFVLPRPTPVLPAVSSKMQSSN